MKEISLKAMSAAVCLLVVITIILMSPQIYREVTMESRGYSLDEFGHRCIVSITGNGSAVWCFELEDGE